MFEWWADLSPLVRYGVACLFLGVSTAFYFSGVFWPWGWAVGVALFVVNMFLSD